MPSPFPGVDPYLEHPDFWPGIHNLLIAEIARLGIRNREGVRNLARNGRRILIQLIGQVDPCCRDSEAIGAADLSKDSLWLAGDQRSRWWLIGCFTAAIPGIIMDDLRLAADPISQTKKNRRGQCNKSGVMKNDTLLFHGYQCGENMVLEIVRRNALHSPFPFSSTRVNASFVKFACAGARGSRDGSPFPECGDTGECRSPSAWCFRLSRPVSGNAPVCGCESGGVKLSVAILVGLEVVPDSARIMGTARRIVQC